MLGGPRWLGLANDVKNLWSLVILVDLCNDTFVNLVSDLQSHTMLGGPEPQQHVRHSCGKRHSKQLKNILP